MLCIIENQNFTNKFVINFILFFIVLAVPSEHAGSEGGEATPGAGAAEGDEQAKEEVCLLK